MHNNVLAELSALSGYSMKDLKARWRELFDTEPPPYSKSYFSKRIAYRLQELAHGIDSQKLDEKFQDAAKGKYGRKRNPAKEIYRPVTGTRLQREWKGEMHQVTVRHDGFEYRGKTYTSLSKIARVITGSVWSGPQFFGLRA